MLIHDALPSTSGRHEAYYAVHQGHNLRRGRKSGRKAQAAAVETAPSNGPVTRDNLEAPEVLKDVERVNPMTDRFEVRSSPLLLIVMKLCSDSGICHSYLKLIAQTRGNTWRRSLNFIILNGGAQMPLLPTTGSPPHYVYSFTLSLGF